MANVSAGDRVQIRVGAVDVTNGVVAKSGWKYTEGSTTWATVEKVVEGWNTGGKFGLPKKVTKVRCKSGSTVVWQVQPEDVVPQMIKAEEPPQTKPDPLPPTSSPKAKVEQTVEQASTSYMVRRSTQSSSLYATNDTASEWRDASQAAGITEVQTSLDQLVAGSPVTAKTVSISGSPFSKQPSSTFVNVDVVKPQQLVHTRIDVEPSQQLKHQTVIDDKEKLSLLLNNQADEIQNGKGYPYLKQRGSDVTMETATYDYQIIPGDSRYSKMTTLESRLMAARAALGLPVHGSPDVARAMKYYLYNRFKTPDINLAHNKTFTHVFFTRPDLNLLYSPRGNGVCTAANSQVLNHTEAAMIWRRYPEIFKLLTRGYNVGDSNNFNMLLSNQVTSFDLQDEELSTISSGKSWDDYSMTYGDAYSGRTAGTFSCDFTETEDLSIIMMLKLWITYIDNVARGAWNPSYDLTNRTEKIRTNSIDDSYVYQRALDYAASAYVLKTSTNGDNLLYWTKYYGVFPLNTGANILGWNLDTLPGNLGKLSIKFAYSYKKDLSPISLLEFNHNAYVQGTQPYVPSFNPSIGQCARPYVGCPFIAMRISEPHIQAGSSEISGSRSELHLRFRPPAEEDSQMTDRRLFRADQSA